LIIEINQEKSAPCWSLLRSKETELTLLYNKLLRKIQDFDSLGTLPITA